MYSLNSDKWRRGVETGVFTCEQCGGPLEFEDATESTFVCPTCGWSRDVDMYGWTDEEYEDLFPTEDEFL